jgi:hypothetical protein
MMKIALAALLTGSVSSPLVAQTVTDIASDTELFVAYCLGRDQQTQKDLGLSGIAARVRHRGAQHLGQDRRWRCYAARPRRCVQLLGHYRKLYEDVH